MAFQSLLIDSQENDAVDQNIIIDSSSLRDVAIEMLQVKKRDFYANLIVESSSGNRAVIRGNKLRSERMRLHPGSSSILRNPIKEGARYPQLVQGNEQGFTGQILRELELSAPRSRAPAPSAANTWPAISKAVECWKELKSDWDDEGAPPPHSTALNALIAFASKCEGHGVTEPEPALHADGELSLHWRGKLRAAISFLSAGRFLAYVERDGKDPVRISGPLDIATASTSMFDALAALH